MTCPRCGNKPLLEPMITYCQFRRWEQISVKLQSNIALKCLLQTGGHFSMSQYVNPWILRTWSTFVQVMDCCLTAPSHYLTMLTSHQWISEAFTWDELRSECPRWYFVQKVWKTYFWNNCHIPRGQWVNLACWLLRWRTQYPMSGLTMAPELRLTPPQCKFTASTRDLACPRSSTSQKPVRHCRLSAFYS